MLKCTQDISAFIKYWILYDNLFSLFKRSAGFRIDVEVLV